MFARSKALTVLLAVATGSAVLAAIRASGPSFVSAPAGVAVPWTALPLPAVRWQPGQAIPPALVATNGFTPGTDELLSGELVITSESQMRHAWRVTFGTPFDPTLVNFQDSFVIWVGGGALNFGGFDVSAVESVDAEYAGAFPGTGTDLDPFLAVTATTFLPGNPPVGIPPFYAVSAVRVPRTHLDDVVFHRTVFAAP